MKQPPTATATQSQQRPATGRILRPALITLAIAAALGTGVWRYYASPTGGAADTTHPSPPGGPGNPAGQGGKRNGFGGGVQAVSIGSVQRQDVRVTASAIGTINAANIAVVRTQVTGVLQSLNFREGQQVKAGQWLAQIDPRAFQAQVGQAQGALARDQAQLDNARADLGRYQDLFTKDGISKQQLDTQLALVHQLEGTVQADRGTVDAAQLQVTYARVVAPISGRAGLKQADLGNIVQTSDTNGIVSIAQTQPAALTFSVPASVLPQITGKLSNHETLRVVALDKSSGKPLAQGKVSSIDNAIDSTTDTIKIKALFPNKDDALFPNQTVSVVLQLDTQKDALTVPQAAVLRGAQGFYVYVVNTDNTVTPVTVQPGTVDKGQMAITGALEVGQKVVIDGVDRLRSGAKVEIIVPGAQGAGGWSKGGGRHNKEAGGNASNAASTASAPPSGPASASK